MIEEAAPPRPRLITGVVFAMLFAILGAAVVFAYFSTFSRPVTTVILVRHAEKKVEPNNPDPDLSPPGEARAQFLVRMFENAGVNAVFATQYKRTQQTVKPLADQLGIPVSIVDSKQTPEVVNKILTEHRGQTVLIAGHNNTVPEIIGALGGGSFPVIPESEYDNMFIVTVYRLGRAKVLKVRYGDVSQPGATSGPMMR
jgi:broad specificity phosphatase PhoE